MIKIELSREQFLTVVKGLEPRTYQQAEYFMKEGFGTLVGQQLAWKWNPAINKLETKYLIKLFNQLL